jgi:Phage related hypothetical protein (DUF1799)
VAKQLLRGYELTEAAHADAQLFEQNGGNYLPEFCLPALELFTSVQTQVSVVGMGSIVGFRYEAVEAASRMLGINITSEVFNHFRSLEAAAVKYWAEKARDK